MKNPFKNLFSKKILGGKSDNFLGIDIGASSIKIVQLKKKKGVVVLETYGELSLGPYAKIESGRATNLSPTELSEALKNLLKESNVSAINCGVSIPLSSSLIFVMELPSVVASNSKQLAQMIPVEARKYIPVPISEVDLDWKIIPQETKSKASFMEDGEENKEKKQDNIEVLVVAIHKETIIKQTEIVKKANLNLEFLEIEIFSTIRAVAGQNLLNFAVLDMGSGSAKLYLVERGIVRDSHTIGRGSQDITLNLSRSMNINIKDAEEKKIKVGVDGVSESEKQVSDIISTNLNYIFIEINKVILNYQKKYNKNIDELIITGGGAIIKGLDQFAKSRTEVEVSIADPFSKVETPAFLDDLLKQVGPGFAVALGIALRGLMSKK